MRAIWTTLFIICYTLSNAQQNVIYGIVSIHNSETNTGKRQYVANAQVEDDLNRAQPTFTNVNGQFSLAYSGVPDRHLVSFQVKKHPLEVVNIANLNAVVGQTDTIRISMAFPDSINEYRRRYYNVGKTQAEKRLGELIAQKSVALQKLQKDYSTKTEMIDQLEQELTTLETERKKIAEQAEELARKYAPVNLDDMSPALRNTFLLFQAGKLDSALLILKKLDLANGVDQILTERQRVNNLKAEVDQQGSILDQRARDVEQALRLKADLCKTLFEFDSTAVCFELLLKLDSNTDVLFDYASFLAWQNKNDKAIPLFNQALSRKRAAAKTNPSTYEPDVARTLNSLGVIYYVEEDFIRADSAYQEALEIYKRLGKMDSLTYESAMARTLGNVGNLYATKNTGTLNTDKNDIAKAESAYQKSLDILRRLAKTDPSTYEPDAARILLDLGMLYNDKNELNRAELAYQEVLKIFSRLAKTNPSAYEPDLAKTLSSLAGLYANKNELIQSETAYRKALEIDKRLATTNPSTYEPQLAEILRHMGALYSAKKDSIRADSAFRQALKIYKRLAKTNPSSYDPDVAKIQSLLGGLAMERNDLIQAEAAHLEALEIYRRLAKTNPSTYEPWVALTQSMLGEMYKEKHDSIRAQAAFREALKIYRHLTKIDPSTYEPDLAETLNNLGAVYENINDPVQAEAAFREAVEIYKRLVKTNPAEYAPELAVMEDNLGGFYRNMKRYGLAEEPYLSCVQIEERLLNANPTEYARSWATAVVNTIDLYDTIISTIASDSAKVTWQLKIVNLYNKLYKVSHDSDVVAGLAENYGTLAWDQLFARKYQDAERSALKGFALDRHQVWIKTNLAHALLLQGRYAEALQVYKELRPLRDKDGQPFRESCLDDLDKLEKAGISQKDFDAVRRYLKN